MFTSESRVLRKMLRIFAWFCYVCFPHRELVTRRLDGRIRLSLRLSDYPIAMPSLE